MKRNLILAVAALALALPGCDDEVTAEAPDASAASAGKDAAADLPGPDASDEEPADAAMPPDAAEEPPDAAQQEPPDASLPTPDAGGIVVPTTCAPSPRTYDPGFSADEYCEQSARVICDRYLNCCRLAPAMYDYCVQRHLADCDRRDLTERIKKGAVQFDLAAAKTCLDKESARPVCSGDFASPECAAASLYQPKAAQNAACVLRFDCVSGRCARPIGQCGGTCQPFVAVGGACNADDLTCDPATAYCSFPSSKSYTGTCAALVPVDGSCTKNAECGEAADCVKPSGSSTGTCKARIAAGQPCSRGSTCVDGYYCSGTCTRTGTVQQGGSCAYSSDCAVGLFCDGFSSTAFGTCAPWRKAGVSCASWLECAPDANCTGGVCTLKQDAGGACATAYDCKWGLRCDSTSGKCVALADVGGGCTTAGDCRLYLNCLSGKCTADRIPDQGACTGTGQCAAGSYCTDDDSPVCATQVADGAVCPDDNEACPTLDCEHKRGTSTGLCRPRCTLP